ncbi:helix-turn-helix transcriptional regulator [Aliivibrio sp.]|uniref:helix-turn-helix transcriptional regulator n=1 Tax=Aliivibrio sp. TaxID=1872443 RepID=UPI003D2F4083
MDTAIISKKQLAHKIGLSESTVYRMIKQKQLPEPLRTPKGHIRGWFAEKIEIWIEQQI